MGAAVSITRLELTAAQLRAAAGREKDGSAARRMLAIAMVLDGADRGTAAETCGMDRQTLRDWVHRYNAEGIRGLHDLKTPGPKPKLTADQQAKLAELVEAGPDPARHGVVRWRRVDLRDELQRCFGVELHERSVGKVLAKLGYRRLSVRPRHPQTDEAAQEAFKKTSPQWSRHGCPTTPKTSPSKSGSRCYGDGLSRYFGSPNQSDGAATMQPNDTVNPTILLAIELSASTWPATPYQRLMADPRASEEVKRQVEAQRTELDPVRLLSDIRAVQQRLVEIADTPEMVAAIEQPSLEQFLTGLRTAWQEGEVRPTARPKQKAKRLRRRPDPFAAVTEQLHSWFEAEPWRTSRELFERLQVEQPGAYGDGQLRTLQRRLKGWRREVAPPRANVR